MKLKRQIKRISNSRSGLAGGEGAEQSLSKPGYKRPQLNRKQMLILFPLFGLAVIGILFGLYSIGSSASLVPKKIQKSVDFPIYYPGSLPSGYVLDTQSFRLAEPGVVLFAVTYSNGKSIVFSEQQQPSDNEMNAFISNYVPINSALQLSLGQAKIGAYGSAANIRTVVSLPIRNGPWLIATAPSEVHHEDLVKILQSLIK